MYTTSCTWTFWLKVWYCSSSCFDSLGGLTTRLSVEYAFRTNTSLFLRHRSKTLQSGDSVFTQLRTSEDTTNWLPQVSGIVIRMYQLQVYAYMSASHEKSPTELTLRQHPSSRSSSTFSFCVWVPVCATLACWQVSNETRSVLGQTKMVPVRWTKYPAVPTGLAVGTNPPGLLSGDHRWGVWEWVKSSVPRIRSVGYSSIQIRY